MNKDLMVIQEIIYQKKKKGAYVINLDEYKNRHTLGCSVCKGITFKKNEVIYFDSFGVEHISEEI